MKTSSKSFVYDEIWAGPGKLINNHKIVIALNKQNEDSSWWYGNGTDIVCLSGLE